MEETERIDQGATARPNHLCVLVHGLWGNPQHLWYLRQALEETYGKEKLAIVVAARNSDTFTYDGIEVGAERVAQEIEDEVERLEKDGTHIKKLSMVGYSLGGLIARYAIGLLYSRGWFDKLKPVNFTTFASPHLGVRAPVGGYHTTAWNYLAARTLSQSGRQLFLIDAFRDHGRPLLSVMVDPNSIFIKALSSFKHRTLYANIINDRSAPYFTTYITGCDPFVDPAKANIRYLPGYEPIILDPEKPIEKFQKTEPLTFCSRLVSQTSSLLTQLPLYAMLTVLVPVGTIVFLLNSGVQEVRSSQRIRLHEEGKAFPTLKSYRIPLMIENARAAVEEAIEGAAGQEAPEYLSEDSTSSEQGAALPKNKKENPTLARRKSLSASHFPTLALSPEQFEMIEELDKVGFRKYRVHIHQVRHSHAAIIVRRQRGASEEGKTVVKHWLDREFEI
ncbi:hypothetical protein MMC30_000339 [Trapelia coarctata]|nr:hypothetical protein [Trapelia coarctata]